MKAKENTTKLDSLKSSLASAKNSSNADKQTQFAEAIKRATMEKDKLIDELRAKDARNADEMASLREQLAQQAAAASQPLVSDLLTSQLLDTDTNPSLEKYRLREIMLTEKNLQLEKQVAMFTTLPVTNDYETIQLNSCNIDDLVIAVYSDEYGSYKIIHTSSTYLHFVHSAIFKSHEQRLSFKTNNNVPVRSNTQLAMSPTAADSPNSSQLNDMMQNLMALDSAAAAGNTLASAGNTLASAPTNISRNTASAPLDLPASSSFVKNSPSDNVDNIFQSEKQPHWFIGRVLVKEFCIARKVWGRRFEFFRFCLFGLILGE